LKSRELYDIKSGKRRKVYSPTEELQYYSSLDRNSLTPEFIGTIGEQWEQTLTDGQKDFINEQKEFKTFLKENQGKFTHVIYNYKTNYLVELNNLDLVRLNVLATYAGSSGKCYDKNRNEITKGSLSDIWDVSRCNIGQTYEKLLSVGAIKMDNKQIIVNTELFKYGVIEKLEDRTYTRMFNDKLLGLYHNTPKKSRKQIGMLIRLLPYINYKYNILCRNPEEYRKEEIKPLNWQEVCNILGQDAEATHTRTKNSLMKLNINGYYVVGQFKTGKGYHLIINPKVYYGGNNLADVKHLYTMFGMQVSEKDNF